jgi:tetratricopeptide (TPR) repeat protein
VRDHVKTALVRHFLDELGRRDEAVILEGRCYEQESIPYKALDSLLDALGRHLKHLPVSDVQALLPRDVGSLTRVFPALRQAEAVATAPQRVVESVDPQESRRRAFAALRELLARLGDRRLLVLFLDDLQWGDVDSALVLAELLRPPDPPVLLLLATYRGEGEATSSFLRTLGAGVDLARIRRDLPIEPLERQEAEDLARELLEPGHPAAEAITEKIACESAGSPFFIHELVRSIRTQTGPSGSERIALDRVLLDRVDRLPEPARHLLEVVAVAGHPIDRWHARRAAGVEGDDCSAIELLRAGRLIRGSGSEPGDQIETYHDRIREAVAGSLTPRARESCHLRIAETLEAVGGADPEFLAEHFRAAGDRRRALSYCVLAAQRAAQALAFDAAARHYKEALELGPPEDDQARRLRARLGDALANAGRGVEAAGNYLTTAGAEGTGPDEALELRQKAAKHLLMSGNIDEGLEVLHAVLGDIGVRSPRTTWGAIGLLLLSRLRVRLRGIRFRERDAARIAPEELRRIDACLSAAEGLGVVDYARGAYFSALSFLDALRVGEPHRAACALGLEAAHNSSERGLPVSRRTGRLIRAAEVIAERLGDPYLLGKLKLYQGIAAYMEGRWLAAYEVLCEAEETLRDRCVGATWDLDAARTFLLWSLTYPGRVAELRFRHGELLSGAKDRGDLYAMMNLGTYIMAVVGVGADQPEAARQEMLRATRQWSQKGFHVQHHNALLARGLLDLYEGQGREAWAYLSAHEPAYRSSLLWYVQHARVDATQLRGRCALGAAAGSSDPAPYLRAASKDARRLERERAPWANALAPLIRAGIAARRGDRASAAVCLAAAIRRLDAVDMEIFAHAARRRLGAILGGDQGRDLITESNSWMAGQGIINPDRIVATFAPGFPD